MKAMHVHAEIYLPCQHSQGGICDSFRNAINRANYPGVPRVVERRLVFFRQKSFRWLSGARNSRHKPTSGTWRDRIAKQMQQLQKLTSQSEQSFGVGR